MPNTKPANKCLPVAQLTQMVPDIPLPPIFRKFPAHYAHQVLDQLEAAAECNALPGRIVFLPLFSGYLFRINGVFSDCPFGEQRRCTRGRVLLGRF